ncbi:LytTR family DNA-binding domain-containing protein [Longimicrobium sp.]|uniref:LytR/AlgR family response regulator transcription factor n=1 Tax=Longimicrobium sp. TaxID=2029185 RepID=UPI002E330136|nr:LytTR family DNA-binding domain-containing protein [Longimicrobium sp.]HEX6041416.1 LytTR family DNA-binding domain-containing protein [Longimicrobium sp.]
MAVIRALVVDDEPLGRDRVRRLLEQEADVEVAGACEDGQEAVDAILSLRPDLVFLDVQMPVLDGFGVIEAVGAARMPPVVFVTAFDRYAISAFEVNALDYLLKPFDGERFQAAMRRVRERLAHPAADPLEARLAAVLRQVGQGTPYAERLVVRTGRQYRMVGVGEVDWLEAADNYVKLHVAGRVLMLRGTLGALEGRLDPRRFLRIHRSMIVNLDRVTSIEPWGNAEYLVVLKDGTKLTSSRGYREQMMELLRG